MKRRSIIEYLNNPKLLDGISISDLMLWIKEVPYVQSLRRFVVMKSKINGEDDKNLLYDAAMYSTDRNKLYDCLSGIHEENKNTVSDINHESSISDEFVVEKVIEVDSGTVDKSYSQDKSDSHDPDSRQHPLSSESTPREIEIKEESKSEKRVSRKENKLRETEVKISELKEVQAGHSEKSGELSDLNKETELSGFSQWLMSMPQVHDEEYSSNLNQKKDVEDENVVSSTLAELLIAQGHDAEAREMYNKLILKYPEKSAYFAAQIEKLKVQ